MSDPTDDDTYKGLSLGDFITHLAGQAEDLIGDVKELNTLGKKPYYDTAFPETCPQEPVQEPQNRAERRRLELEQRKAAKKNSKK